MWNSREMTMLSPTAWCKCIVFASILLCWAHPVLSLPPVNDIRDFSSSQHGLHRAMSVSAVVGGNERVEFVPSTGGDNCAQAHLVEATNTTGWGFLNVSSNGSFADDVQALCAGYVEGFLTVDYVLAHYKNMITENLHLSNVFDDVPTPLVEFFTAQADSIAKYTPSGDQLKDAMYAHSKLMLKQIEGIQSGVNDALSRRNSTLRISMVHLLLLNSLGDLGDILVSLNLTAQFNWMEATFGEAVAEFERRTSCSAYVGLIRGGQEVVVGHTTWTYYASMLRLYKSYSFQLNATVYNQDVLMSSYPGVVSSFDDYYIAAGMRQSAVGERSVKLIVTETTNLLFDDSSEPAIDPRKVLLSWQRVMGALRMAETAPEFTQLIQQAPSGTYTNQWMVVDAELARRLKHIHRGSANVLWIAEELPYRPGGFLCADMTSVLVEQSYWGSFNRPYFEEVFNALGYPLMVKKFGDFWTHDKNPRALIFARNHTTVESLDDLQLLIRYNNWETDPLASGNAVNAIAARSDLVPPGPQPPNPDIVRRAHGGTDGKVSSTLWSFVENATAAESTASGCTLRSRAVSGPTWDQQPVFSWSGVWKNASSHEMHPESFRFPWVEVRSGDL